MKAVLTLRSGSEQRHTLALLGSLCLFLSAVEYIIPKPLPFMRLGLANLPLLLALDILGPLNFFLLALLKVLGQGLISGSLFSYIFLFSLAGTFSSAALMYLLRYAFGKKRIGFAGIGCAGAMISNGVQLLLAKYLIFGAGLQYLAPPLLASGFVTGIALGIFCEFFCRQSQWYAKHTAEGESGVPSAPLSSSVFHNAEVSALKKNIWEERRTRRHQRWNEMFSARALFITGIIMAVLFTFNPSMIICVILFAFFCFLAWFSGKKNNIFITLIVMAGIVFVNLLAPYGKVLAELGPLHITQGSLLAGLKKALVLEGLLMLSGACVKSELRLPGRIGSLLAESFRLLELMREHRPVIRRGQIIAGIDSLLLKMDSGS
ncbi:MAG: Gx transporter family protein [Treponema sp.]|jgi:heptaprenyl diphosphate synthase|nr:Gx transporter family protein [Treponema sp.]